MFNGPREFSIRNDLRELESLIEQVTGVCAQIGIPESIFHDVRLAIEEAVSNTIRHGYDDEHPHEIRLTLERQNDNLYLQIQDDGKPFNPLDAGDPDLSLPVEHKQIGGLGIYLIKAVMDKVEYEHVNGKNLLKMTKSL